MDVWAIPRHAMCSYARSAQIAEEDAVDEPTLPNRPVREIPGMNERIRATLARSLPLRILLIVLLIALLGAAFFIGVYTSRQPRPTFATAHTGNVIISVAANGTIQPTLYHADFPVDGALSEIDVSVGQQVKAGDTLAKLHVAPFQNALTAAQASDSAAQQSLDAAQEAQSDAQSSVDAASSALDAQQSYAQTQCTQSPNDPDACGAANAAVARAQAQLAAAQAQASAAQAQLAAAQTTGAKADGAKAIAQAQLAATTLVAPHAGVVTVINGAVGGKPGATATGIASFITIADTSAPLATALVGYKDIDAIHVGESATFRVKQASSGAIFTGVVTGVSPVGQGTGAALSYPVALKIDPASLGHTTLLPGMSAETRIITHARYDVLVIAQSAVSYARTAAPPNGSGVLTKSQVIAALKSAQALEKTLIDSGFDTSKDPLTATYLVGFGNGHYFAIPVVLGLSDGHNAEVVSGLQNRQMVVDGQRSLLFG
jgi:multidrug efflux pump subunit AcrA (membrane-fusion protein)